MTHAELVIQKTLERKKQLEEYRQNQKILNPYDETIIVDMKTNDGSLAGLSAYSDDSPEAR